MLTTDFIDEKKIQIGDIPALLLRPRNMEENIPSLIFYHGWTSNKESQRMRGLILATFGFQVLIPDAIYHGERNPIPYSRANHRYFWEIIFKNLEEADLLIDELINKYGADPDRIIAMGHSMGGFTAGGIFTHNKRLGAAIAINASLAWDHANKILLERLGLEIDQELRQIEEKLLALDPINNLDKLGDRPMLLLNGGGDLVVSPKSQRYFYKKAKEDNYKINYIEYSYVGHFITTNMMEDSIKWLKKLDESR